MQSTINATNYYQQERHFIQNTVGPLVKNKKILDVGCGTGRLGKIFKEHWGATYVAGIELNKDAADQARENIDSVVCGNVENIELPYDKRSFDVLLFGDLLEHLVDPWSLLESMTSYLKTDGIVCISIPNIRQINVLLSLALKGDWKYQESGIMDRTHLRFFTKKSLIDMVKGADLEIISCQSMLIKKPKFINFVTFGVFEEFLTHQWLCIARGV